MLSFHAWAEKHQLDKEGRPWLILGKGPSFTKRGQYDLSQFRLFSINHVVREQKVDVAHVIDLDVVLNCPQAFLDNADILVMGDDWQGKFDHLKSLCDVIYLPRTPSVSTTEIIEVVKTKRT